MSILLFLFGMILLCGAIALPDSRTRYIVILQNFLLVAGITVLFGALLLEMGF